MPGTGKVLSILSCDEKGARREGKKKKKIQEMDKDTQQNNILDVKGEHGWESKGGKAREN